MDESEAENIPVSRRRTCPCHRRADERQERLPRGQARGPPRRAPEARTPAYSPALLRDSSAGIRRGSAHHSTAAWPCGSQNHQPLPALVGGAAQSHPEPAGHAHPGEASRGSISQTLNASATPGVGRCHLASRRRGELVPLSQQLLAAAPVSTPARIPTSPEPLSLWICPICGGPMVLIERLTARQIALRSPPLKIGR